ncbi:MAG: FAD-dependent oxidoreductase [Alphaproteobacteria bacterium]|nr:FAD-dependent oxidoreductase [Alphaproteobacteria bacterium]
MAARTWDQEVDVVVVGSGAAGYVAALVVADRGGTALIVEKEPKWGGTSAYSGGGLWMPNNPLMARDGAGDSRDNALRYLDAVIGDVGPASSAARREAFVDAAPKVVQDLADKGIPWIRAELYPDYYPDKPGGMIGRGVECAVFDGKRLGPWLATLAGPPNAPPVAMTTRDVHYLPVAVRTWAGFVGTMRVFARTLWWMLTGRRPLGIGAALLGRLMRLALDRNVPVWLSSPMRELVEEDGRVVGVVVERDGRPVRVRARRGVMLTAGGFARNVAMRRAHQPVGDTFTSVSPGDTGDAILAGEKLSAATALMDDAWWGPSFLMPDGTPAFAVYERSMPGCILVDANGLRFTNESTSYIDAGHDMLDLNPGGEPAPTWLVLDAHHRRRYLFGQAPPGLTPKDWFTSGFLQRADTLDDLARQCGIDAKGLKATVAAFNEAAARGVDGAFHRGATAYDRYYGDASVRPNPNLGPIAHPPFYAARMVPGDLGTKGGLLTDAHARVLRTDGTVIEGLYAAGNTTASVMGRTYPGPGSTLGPAVTFAWIGAHHALDTHGAPKVASPRTEEVVP